MKAPFSSYLAGIKPGLKALIDRLGGDFDYVSILATDSKGLAVRISRHQKSVADRTMTTERGIVVRVLKDGLYSEYALNRFDPENADAAYAEIVSGIEAQSSAKRRKCMFHPPYGAP